MKRIVLFDFYDWDITLREVVFSVLIAGVMFFIGFLLAGKVNEMANNSTLAVRQAPALYSDSEFQHAMKTDVGNAFANGKLVALKPVTNQWVPGKFLRVYIEHQEYRMHTRTITTTDSKGHTHTHIQHYWSWDTIRTEEHHSDTVSYCGVTFPYSKFSYWSVPGKSTTHKNNLLSDRREIIYTKPMEFTATIFAKCVNNGLEGDGIELQMLSMEDARKDMADNHWTGIFWFIWTVLTILVLFMFYYIPNEWLEDEEKREDDNWMRRPNTVVYTHDRKGRLVRYEKTKSRTRLG